MSQVINNNQKQTIVNSWSLIAFARLKGPRMQVGEFVNKSTGEVFHSCIFTNKNAERCFVAFSSNLGELTSQEIATQQNKLQVVQLESGSYHLCKQGQNSWQDVALEL